MEKRPEFGMAADDVEAELRALGDGRHSGRRRKRSTRPEATRLTSLLSELDHPAEREHR